MEDGGRVLVLTAEEGMVAHMARGECVIGVLSGMVPPPLPCGCYLVEDEESVDADFAGRVYARFCHKPWNIGENEHLFVREFSAEDIEALYRLEQGMQACPDVSGILGELSNAPWAQLSEEEKSVLSKRLLSYIDHQYSFYEYGLWGIYHKPAGKLIGMCGFSTTDEVDMSLGYYIFPTYRRYGYATQACRIALDFVREWQQAEEVYAVIGRDNLASQSIARTLGFTETKDDGQCLYYRKDLTEKRTDEKDKETGALLGWLTSVAGKYFRRK